MYKYICISIYIYIYIYIYFFFFLKRVPIKFIFQVIFQRSRLEEPDTRLFSGCVVSSSNLSFLNSKFLNLHEN